VLVRARVDGRDYWLDGARQGDRDLDEAPTPAYGWVLPLDSAGAGLVRLKPAPGVRPQVLQVIRYDASGGVTKDEPTELETTLRGDAGVVAHAQMSAVPQDRLEASLKAYWAQLHTAFTPTHVAAAWDPATGEEKLTAEGTSKLDWSGAGLELHHVEFGGALDIKRDPAASDPDAPYSVDFPSFTETDESVVLPPGDDLPPDSAKATDVDTVIGGVAYRRTGVLSGHTLKVTLISKALQPEITAAEARASVTPLTTLGQQGVYAPAGSQSQAANDAANIDSHPSTADGHFDRAAALLDAGRYPEAVAEFDAAIALDPKSQKAWSGRALAHAALLDPAAITDADKADTLGPPQTFSASARGTLAFNTGDMAGARIAFRQVMVLDPKDDSTLTQLLSLDLQAGDPDAADRDLEALKQAKPDTALRYHLWKARIAEARGNKDAARQELAQAPGDTADTLIERSKVYFGLGDLDRARADADAAIHMKPSVQAWSARANADGGYASPKAAPDLDAAIKLAPNDQEVILWQVSAAMMRRDFATALEQIDRLIVVNRGARGEMLTRRAQIEVRLGQDADADSDFSSGRTAT
ncbi:MAG: tetratricopeptide repeat protein, partial [Caulobacteraceae bacterium]